MAGGDPPLAEWAARVLEDNLLRCVPSYFSCREQSRHASDVGHTGSIVGGHEHGGDDLDAVLLRGPG